MVLKQNNLTIRDAVFSDAEQLCEWWGNGKIMAHAGFPNGLQTNLEELRNDLVNATDSLRIFMIELNDKLIGEMNYKKQEQNVVAIGIKICDFTKHDQGLGTILLTMFIDALFKYHGYQKITLDTNLENKRAIHTYQKVGFEIIRTNKDSWRNQLGEMQSTIDFELKKENWHYNNEYFCEL